MHDFAQIDKQMHNTQWVASGEPRQLYDALRLAILNLARPGEDLAGPVAALPDPNTPFAWRPLFEFYGKLKRRDALPPDPAIARAEADHASSERDWNTYLQNRDKIVALAKRGAIDSDTLEFLGLQSDDLVSGVSNDPNDRYGGRAPNWSERAHRLACAISRLEHLSAADRAAIPNAMMARRAEARTAALVRRNEDLEARLAALEAAESQKETRGVYENG